MPIDISEVQPGDLIFTYKTPWERGGISDHVSMCTWTNRGRLAHIVHQIADPSREAYGTFRTDLVPPKPGGNALRVLRCSDFQLALRAAQLAMRWDNQYQLPFADARVMFADKYETGLGTKKKNVVETHRSLFQQGGKYRAIKYAARRNGYLCYPEEGGNRSMFCSMFVTVCYQVAGLHMADAVEAQDIRDLRLRVSDKRMKKEDVKQLRKDLTDKKLDFEGYRNYCAFLKDSDPYSMRKDAKLYAESRSRVEQKGLELEYLPSIKFWNYTLYASINTFDWQKWITEGMMVDAKVIMPAGLCESLLADEVRWEDKGCLVGQAAFTETQEEKFHRMRGKMVIEEGKRKDFIARSFPKK